MKKLISFASCALLMISLFTGCSSGKSDGVSPDITESFVYRTKDTGLINENETLIDMNISDDKLILTKNRYNKVAEFISFDIEKGTSQTHRINCSDFSDKFVEGTEILSDDENYYLFDVEMGTSYLYTVNRKSQKISSVDFPDKNIEKILVGKKDSVYILYSEYEIRKQHCYLEKYTGGKSAFSIDLADILSGGNMIDFNDIYIDKNENIFVLYTQNDTVYTARMNMNGEISAESAADGISGRMNRFVISGDNTIFVVSYDESGRMLLLNSIDSETCKTKGMYEEEICEIYSGYADYDYITEKDGEFSGVIAESGERCKIDINENGYDLIYTCKNEITMFRTKYDYETILVKTDINAEETASEYQIETGNDSYVVDSVYQNNRHIYLCENKTGQFILFTDEDGKTIDKVQLKSTDSYRYIQIETDEDDSIYLVSTDEITGLYQKYDKDMNCVSEIYEDSIKGVNELLDIENELYSFSYDGVIYHVDFTNKKLQKKETEILITDIYLCDGKLLMMDNTGIVYMSENDCITEVLNTSELPEAGNDISKILFDGTDRFYIYSDIQNTVSIISKVNTSEIEDSSIINVAYDIDSAEIKDVISTFNSENENVIVRLSDYSTDEKIEKLNIEMAGGNVPDVIISDGRIDLSVYENLGVLVDMSEFIENDETVDIADYYTNIFKSCSESGKITQIVPFYSVITGFGKTSVLGNKTGWNYSEFLETVSANKDKDILYKGILDNEISYIDAVYFALSSNINISTGKFEYNEDLIKFLAELKPYIEYKFDDNSDYDKNELSNDFDLRFREDKVLFDIANIRNVESVCIIKDGIVNDEFIFKGVPSEKGNGSYVLPGRRIVMLNSCKDKDTAWKFIRQFLTDEFQEEYSMLFLPVKKSTMEKMYERCEEKKVSIGDELCDIHKPTQHDREIINEWIASLSVSVISENRISGIILGELDRYLNGELNEKETLNEIKRKIEMYLSEV